MTTLDKENLCLQVAEQSGRGIQSQTQDHSRLSPSPTGQSHKSGTDTEIKVYKLPNFFVLAAQTLRDYFPLGPQL